MRGGGGSWNSFRCCVSNSFSCSSLKLRSRISPRRVFSSCSSPSCLSIVSRKKFEMFSSFASFLFLFSFSGCLLSSFNFPFPPFFVSVLIAAVYFSSNSFLSVSIFKSCCFNACVSLLLPPSNMAAALRVLAVFFRILSLSLRRDSLIAVVFDRSFLLFKLSLPFLFSRSEQPLLQVDLVRQL